jgi:hypothetical protein
MRKLMLILIFVSIFWQAKSQITKDTMPWCPPGASWLYKSSSPSSNMYFQFNYIKDTLFLGITVKKLNVEAIQIFFGPNRNEFVRRNGIVGFEFLYNANDSIYWYDKISDNFKFIYSFNPKLNDEFIVGNSRAKCYADPNFPKLDTIKVTKLYKDTFESIIFDVFDTDYKSEYDLGKIVKNIGSTSAPFPQVNPRFCNDFEPEYGIYYDGLICYSDSLRGTLTFWADGKEECHFAKTFIKKIEKNGGHFKSNLYPNPANNFIKVENAENIKYQSFCIYNYLGKEVMMQNNYNEIIDISNLNNGLYFIKIYHSNGITETIKFLKDDL